MHGVGDKLARLAFDQGGFTKCRLGARAAEARRRVSDGRFPNPEEKGRDGSLVRARPRAKADLVLANDPDADRLAVALPSAALPAATSS